MGRAALDAHAHVLGDDDAVVDQQAQRNDHGGDRHALEFDTHDRHQDDAGQHRNRHQRADDQAGANAQEHQHDEQHDAHGLVDILHRLVDAVLDQGRLVGGVAQLHADGQFVLDLVDQGGQQRSELDVVGAVMGRNAHDDSWPTVVEDGLGRWIWIAGPDVGDLADRDQVPGFRVLKQDVGDILGVLQRTRRHDHKLPAADEGDARRFRLVLRDQRVGGDLRVHAQLGNANRIELDEDLLVLDAVELDLAHRIELHDPGLDILRRAAHVLIRKAVGPERHGGDGNQADILLHGHARDCLGQGRRGVFDPVSYRLDSLGHVGHIVADRGRDDG